MIELKNISYSFNDKQVLSNLNLSIEEGSFHSLIGVSGSGKSITLKLLASLLPLQKGEIKNRPQNISLVFQESPLIPWLTIKENLTICSQDKNEIDQYLIQFNLDEYKNYYPSEISGGMIQKINILRSFLNKAELILMDEPFVHIDLVQRLALHRFVLELWKKHRPTILFVTHDIDEAIFLSETASLFSSKDDCIIETFKMTEINENNMIEMRQNKNYATVFDKIYNHLKKELS